MRYIGGKKLMLDNIFNVLEENKCEINVVCDLFSGSGIVAKEFKNVGYNVDCNDLLYFSYCINRGTISLNKKPTFEKLKEKGIHNPIQYLNTLEIKDTNINLNNCFIRNNYSLNNICDRMYLQEDNALKIDIIRITIEQWKQERYINDNEYFYLLSALINAVPYVSNITGVYGAYLKKWDKRTYNKLELKENDIVENDLECKSFNLNAIDFIKDKKYDLVYIDPPYNERQYLPNYHLLETIAKYDYPNIKGKTGIREYSKDEKSKFCSKKTVYKEFDMLLKGVNSRYVLISYNNEGLLSTSELTQLCEKYAKEKTFKLYEYDYRKFKSNKNINGNGLKEQLYYFEKEDNNE